MSNLMAELKRLHSEAAPGLIGKHKICRFRTVTPAHTFECVIKKVRGGRLIELTARDSFDAKLAKFLFDQAENMELLGMRAKTIRVAEAEFPDPWPFEVIVVVPPDVAKRFEHQSTSLSRATYWLLPAFEGEFADRADAAAFWHQINRKGGWRSVVVDWDRSRKTKPVFDG